MCYRIFHFFTLFLYVLKFFVSSFPMHTPKLMMHGFELISHHQHTNRYKVKTLPKQFYTNSMKWQMVTRRIMWSFTAIFSGVPWTYSNLEMHGWKTQIEKNEYRFRYTVDSENYTKMNVCSVLTIHFAWVFFFSFGFSHSLYNFCHLSISFVIRIASFSILWYNLFVWLKDFFFYMILV